MAALIGPGGDSPYRRELESLRHEANPQIFAEGLLQVGRRLEASDRLEDAGRVYSALIGAAGEVPDVARRARQSLDALSGGSSPLRAEFLLRRLARDTMEPASLIGLTAASAVFRMTRLATLSRLVGTSSAQLLTRGFGARAAASLAAFGAEALAFPLATRGAATLLGRPIDWNRAQVGRDIAGSFLVLGAMKLTGGLATRLLPLERAGGLRNAAAAVMQQGALFSGIVLGHRLETAAGLRPQPAGATGLVDSLALLLQFHAAGRLAQSAMGPGFRLWEAGLEARTRSLSNSDRTSGPNFRFSFGREALAAGPSVPAEERPRVSPLSFMVGSGGKGRPTHLPLALRPVLRQVEHLEDPKAAGLAMRWIYTRIVGPLRSKVFYALDELEGGVPPKRVLKSLMKDPRLKDTIFLTEELRNFTVERIIKLARGEVSIDSGRPEPAVLPLSSLPPSMTRAQKYQFLSSDEVIRLNLERAETFVAAFRNRTGDLPLPAESLLQDVLALQSYMNGVTRRIMRQADIDTLTGISNRNYWDRQIPDLERRLMRPVSEGEGTRRSDWILLIDIDHFKKINDTYGHTPNGDEALWSVAQNIVTVLRPRDLVARWGGEEFSVYLFNSGREGALRVAEEIRRTVEATEIEIQEVPGVASIRANVSIGGAEMRLVPGPEAGSLTSEGAIGAALTRADENLYQAKESGRNRVVLPEK